MIKKFFIECDVPEEHEDAFKLMVADLKTVVDNSEIAFHVHAPGTHINVEKLKEFLQGIMSDPEYSRNTKFATEHEYLLYCELAKLVKAPLFSSKRIF